MTCPSCGVDVVDAVTECPSCGVIFAKWAARQAAKASSSGAASSEGGGAAPGGAPSQLRALGMPLLYLALTFGAVYGLWRWDSGRRAKAGPEGALDPERFKPAITALEQALYKEEGPAYKVASSVEAAAQALALELRESSRVRGPMLSAPVWELGGAAGASAQSLGTLPGERERWIRDWEALRARIFKPAPWFHVPVAVDPAQPPIPAAEAADRLEKAAFALAALLSAVEGELKDYPERGVTLYDLEPGARDRGQALQDLERWRAWVPSWHSRVRDAAALLPSQKAVPEALWRAKELMDRVVAEMVAVPNPGAGKFLMASEPDYNAVYLPSRYSRDAWLGNMKRWLGDARKLAAEARSGGAERK